MAETTPPAEAPETTMSKISETRRIWFAGFIWLTFIAYIVFVSIYPAKLPGDTLGIILGGLLTYVGIVIGYYFQTSMGSSIKSQIMGVLGRKPDPTVVVTPPPDQTTTTTTTTEPKTQPTEGRP